MASIERKNGLQEQQKLVIVDVEMEDYPDSYQHVMPQLDDEGTADAPSYSDGKQRPHTRLFAQLNGNTHLTRRPEIVPVSWRDNRAHNAIKHAKKTWNKPLMRSKYGTVDLHAIPEDEEHIVEESPMLAPRYEKVTLRSKMGCPLCSIS